MSAAVQSDLKHFVVSTVGSITGVKETATWMVVTTYKEAGTSKFT